jgi:hypothetical protein
MEDLKGEEAEKTYIPSILAYLDDSEENLYQKTNSLGFQRLLMVLQNRSSILNVGRSS